MEQIQDGGDGDASNFIIRVWMQPFYLDKLARYLGLFDEIVSSNIERGLVHLSETHSWMNYENTQCTLHIEDPQPAAYGSYRSGVVSSGKLQAIQTLFSYVCNGNGWELTAVPSDQYRAMPEVLTLFRANEDLCAQFHAFFPYFEGEFRDVDPTSIFMYWNGNGKTHWEVLLEASRKEVTNCRTCSCRLPWARTITDIGSCECRFPYRTDFLERTNRNPYFDDDNRWQRERDWEDEARRQMQD